MKLLLSLNISIPQSTQWQKAVNLERTIGSASLCTFFSSSFIPATKESRVVIIFKSLRSERLLMPVPLFSKREVKKTEQISKDLSPPREIAIEIFLCSLSLSLRGLPWLNRSALLARYRKVVTTVPRVEKREVIDINLRFDDSAFTSIHHRRGNNQTTPAMFLTGDRLNQRLDRECRQDLRQVAGAFGSYYSRFVPRGPRRSSRGFTPAAR